METTVDALVSSFKVPTLLGALIEWKQNLSISIIIDCTFLLC